MVSMQAFAVPHLNFAALSALIVVDHAGIVAFVQHDPNSVVTIVPGDMVASVTLLAMTAHGYAAGKPCLSASLLTAAVLRSMPALTGLALYQDNFAAQDLQISLGFASLMPVCSMSMVNMVILPMRMQIGDLRRPATTSCMPAPATPIL